MSKRAVLLVAVLVLGATGGPAVGLASADVTLEIVVQSDAGDSIGNAEVTASWDDGSRTRTTASNGRVFIDVPEGADVTIEVNHTDYVRNSPFELNDAGNEEVTVTVWEKASASVTVVDAGGPVEGVDVVFEKDGDEVGEFTTDSQGVVDTGTIESGEYELTLSKSGYFDETTTLTVEGETTEEVRIERGSVTVEFRVLDDNFDPPQAIPDATISGEKIGTVPTQADGTRSVSVPVNTRVSVTVEKDGYVPADRTFRVREQDRSINITTHRVDALNIEVGNERVVVGEAVQVTVTDEYDEAVPDATVFLDGSAVGQPDETGVLRVPIESAGEHTLSASAGELSSDEVAVTGIEPGAESTPPSPTETETPDDDGGLTVGDVNLRSAAIGIAGGLVLAVVLFVFLRFR